MRAHHLLLIPVAVGCSGGTATSTGGTPTHHREPVSIATSQVDREINAMTPTSLGAGHAPLSKAIASHFEQRATQRAYIMTDKPLYQPGETIWFRADLRATGTLLGGRPVALTMQLVAPRGAIVETRRVLARDGVARNDFRLPAELDGGEYEIRLLADDGTHDTKKIVVNTYEAPRLQKSLELLRKAYGEGDEVTAALEIKRATGEPFAQQTVTGVITVDDVELPRLTIRTDAHGKAAVRFTLPDKLTRGDGLLTIMADDGGVTESIQKRIPIVMKTLQLGLYPEGGDLVANVPGRVYFMARTTLGKPADIAGKVLDDRGRTVAELSSIHDGLGRFELTPETDRTYKVEITRPAGITATFEVPAARDGGCVVRSVDQLHADRLRVAAICNTRRSLLVEAVLRERRIGGGSFDVEAGEPAVVELPIPTATQGVARVTLFSARREPLAERLVYHGMGADLHVAITADKKRYTPRDPVTLKIRTTDGLGQPVKANLGLAVVDETVLSYADDKSGNLLSRMYLEPELGPGEPIEEPNFYFSDKPEAAAAMDALLATRGYRRFEWRPVLDTIAQRAQGGAR